MAILPTVPDPELNPDEHVIESWRANHVQGAVAVGGKLFLTSSRLRFQPVEHGALMEFVAAIGSGGNLEPGQPWSCALASVQSVSQQDKDPGQLWSGGLGKRLLLNVSGESQLFVVGDLEEAIAAIRKATQ